MKPECYRHRHAKRGIMALCGILVILLAFCCMLSSCRQQSAKTETTDATRSATGASNTTASDTPEPTSYADKTVGGSAPGQVTSDTASSLPGKVMQRAIGEKCEENLRQVRMMVQAAQTEDGNPSSLAEIPEAASIRKCPLGHEDYTYDPNTGEVHCPHPGHEKY